MNAGLISFDERKESRDEKLRSFTAETQTRECEFSRAKLKCDANLNYETILTEIFVYI